MNIPIFKQGEEASASKLNMLGVCLREIIRLVKANKIQPGKGLKVNQGSGGVTLSVVRNRGGGRAASVSFPFAVSIAEEEVDGKKTYFAVVSKNGGVFSDIMGQPYQIPWENGIVRFRLPNDGIGLFAITLDWTYKQAYSKATDRAVQMSVVKIVETNEDPDALKSVITPITGSDIATATGNSRVVLAVVEGKMVAETLTFTFEQLVVSSLRAYWLPGYVDDVPGAIGQYADVSIGYYSKG